MPLHDQFRDGIRPAIGTLFLWYFRSILLTPALFILFFSLVGSFILLILAIQGAAPDSGLQAPLLLLLIGGIFLPGTIIAAFGGFFGPLILWFLYGRIHATLEERTKRLKSRFPRPVRTIATALTLWHGGIATIGIFGFRGEGADDAFWFLLGLYIASMLSALWAYGVSWLFENMRIVKNPNVSE